MINYAMPHTVPVVKNLFFWKIRYKTSRKGSVFVRIFPFQAKMIPKYLYKVAEMCQGPVPPGVLPVEAICRRLTDPGRGQGDQLVVQAHDLRIQVHAVERVLKKED